MEEYKRIAAVALNDTETTLYTNSNGAIVKTILMCNTAAEEVDVTLSLDSVQFVEKPPVKKSEGFCLLVVDKI